MPTFKILALCLHGGNTPADRVKSCQAFQDFKRVHDIGQMSGSQMCYTDDRGYVVFCLVLLVTDEYREGSYITEWERLLSGWGVDPVNSYEGILDFSTAVFGDYTVK